MDYFLCVIGMVFVIEAVPYMLFPIQVKALARRVENIPVATLQIIGLASALTGLVPDYRSPSGPGRRLDVQNRGILQTVL